MKTLHLTIIVSTVAIATILAFLILHNESDSIFTSKELTVEGLKDTYGVGEQINFKIEFDELLGSLYSTTCNSRESNQSNHMGKQRDCCSMLYRYNSSSWQGRIGIWQSRSWIFKNQSDRFVLYPHMVCQRNCRKNHCNTI